MPSATGEGSDLAVGAWSQVPFASVICDAKDVSEFFNRQKPVGLGIERVRHQPAIYDESKVKKPGVWRALQQTLQHALSAKVEPALVMEADVLFYDDWHQVVPQASQAIRDGKCEAVFLGGGCVAYGEYVAPRIRRGQCIGMEATLLSLRAMQLISEVNASTEQLETDDWIRSRLRLCASVLPVASQAGVGNFGPTMTCLTEVLYAGLTYIMPYTDLQMYCVGLASGVPEMFMQIWWAMVGVAMPGGGSPPPVQ